ncbi:hypothetical protein ABK905_25550 [Acerihabitans sp. KWT182]|uniref:HNH endonuclease n=1 Tax=Acerihabitans sp. KWT182 TaxID=3157919 RepID=A0AAU7Q9E2_9GAMM
MDSIAPADPSVYLLTFPPVQRQSSEQLKAILGRLRNAQNCCCHCRPLWRQWQEAADSIVFSAAAKGITVTHPSGPILIGLSRMNFLSAKMVTDDDKAAMIHSGFNPATHTEGDNSAHFNHFIARIANDRGGKSETQISGEERAAMHYYSYLAMGGLLKRAIIHRVRESMVYRNRDYRPANNGLPPFRDPLGNSLEVHHIAGLSARADSGKHYRSATVLPFVSTAMTGAEREQLFLSLHCRRISEADVSPLESSLMGQWGVFAAKSIAKGCCLGVYAGVLVSPLEMGDANLFDHDYIVDLSIKGQPVTYLDSEGILSKINTRFHYDDLGMPVAQAKKATMWKQRNSKPALSMDGE